MVSGATKVCIPSIMRKSACLTSKVHYGLALKCPTYTSLVYLIAVGRKWVATIAKQEEPKTRTPRDWLRSIEMPTRVLKGLALAASWQPKLSRVRSTIGKARSLVRVWKSGTHLQATKIKRLRKSMAQTVCTVWKRTVIWILPMKVISAVLMKRNN